MNLSMHDFFQFLFHEKDTYDNESEINRLVYETSAKKMNVAAIAAIIIFSFMTLRSFRKPELFGKVVIEYRSMYLLMIIYMIAVCAVISYVKRNYDERYPLMKWFNPMTAFFVVGWTIGYTCLGMIANGLSPLVIYRIAVMAVPLCIYMHPLAYVVVTVSTDVIMIVSMFNIVDHSLRSSIGGIGQIILLIVRIMLGLAFLYMEFTVRERIITYEAQKKEISDLSNAQNRFFSSMSHEIRTPINTIIGLNEMILREKVSDEVAEDAANIRAASNMLLHLINDILDMSKISSGQMKLTPVNYHPGDMLSEIVGMLWLRAREKGLEFNVELAPDIPSELYGDEVRIKQILINVLNNAIKYTQKGSVTLSIQCDGIDKGVADIVYSVKDTGIGIKKESLPHLFTAFKRVDEEENRYIEGTGLGLSIVKELTELMGGKVTVNSIYTQGSTFIIEIPQTVTDFAVIKDLKFDERHKAGNMSGNYHASFEAPDAKVLAVDDNGSNLLVVEKLLRDTKVKVDTASSGTEALEKTLETSYDVILMDHLMPEMDGIECFRKIRNQTGGASKRARVVALTANAGSDMQKLYANEGFDGYLEKPVDAKQLENELLRLLPKDMVRVHRDDGDIIETSMSWIDDHRKKKPIVVTTESVADIPRTLMDELGIDVIPHKVETENGIFADGDEIDSDGLLDYIRSGHEASTHAPSSHEHEKFFAEALSHANNVIHLTISTRIENSGYDDAIDGASAFDNVTIFDTRHLSSGQGLLAIRACEYVSEGLSVGEIINRLMFLRNYIHTSFIVDNLDYLARSNQVSKKLAAIAKSMMFHPVIDMRNGRMTTYRFYFGSRMRAWNRYVASTLSNVSNIDKRVLFITYVGLTEKEIEKIKGFVEKRVKFERVYVQKASPTIAVNSGPGTFGLLFADKV